MKITNMNLLEYVSPEGEIIVHPNLDELKELILSGQEDYWCGGSGQGYFTWYEKENTPLISLALTFSEKYGFWLEYRDKRRQEGSYTSLGDGDLTHENAIEVYICGDSLLLPSAFFVSPDKACLAVMEFSQNGHMTNSVTWGIKGAQGWDYGDPDGFV